jgi:hypothetical protein
MSKPAGLMLASELAQAIAKNFTPAEGDDFRVRDHLQQVADQVVAGDPDRSMKLREWVAEHFDVARLRVKPTAAYHALVDLPSGLTLTLNYDELPEAAVRSSGRGDRSSHRRLSPPAPLEPGLQDTSRGRPDLGRCPRRPTNPRGLNRQPPRGAGHEASALSAQQSVVRTRTLVKTTDATASAALSFLRDGYPPAAGAACEEVAIRTAVRRDGARRSAREGPKAGSRKQRGSQNRRIRRQSRRAPLTLRSPRETECSTPARARRRWRRADREQNPPTDRC